MNMPSDLPELHISSEPEASEDDVDFVQQGLRNFNNLFFTDDGFQPLHLFLRRADGIIAGGLQGEIYWGWLHISILWIDEHYRGQGYGEQMLKMAEDQAILMGCRTSHLDTLSFQAKPFYEKNGYTVFGVLEDHPIGHQRIFLKKKLQ
jgi:GNAT superfamily N-acetyltransferase